MGADAALRDTAEAALLALTQQPSLGGLCRSICAGECPATLLGTLAGELDRARGLPTSQVHPSAFVPTCRHHLGLLSP